MTLLVILFTSIVSIYCFSNTDLKYKLTLNPVAIEKKSQYYRFVTSGLIHSDYQHLIFNMLSLFFFGGVVQSKFEAVSGNGAANFLLLYITGLVVSDLPSYFKNKNDAQYNSLGASGAVSAIIFSSILLNPTDKICLYFAFCIPGFLFGAIYLIYSAYMSNRNFDHINHDAHLYGAIWGVLWTLIFYPNAAPIFWYQIQNWSF